jgi:hypothetical protein
MSSNINQIFTANPATTFQSTDLLYLGRSPYGVGNDMAFQYSTLASQFLTTTGPATITGNLTVTGNLVSNNIAVGTNVIVAIGGTTTLTNASGQLQVIGGSSGTIVLPDATTLPIGQRYVFNNGARGSITLETNGGATLATLVSGSYLTVYLLANGTTAGTWSDHWEVPANVTWGTAGVTNLNLITPTIGAATATSLAFSPTTGGIIGTATNDNAGAGKVGEFISSTIASGSSVSLTTSVAANVTSVGLTAGDWDLFGNVTWTITGTTSGGYAWISSTSATTPDGSLSSGLGIVTPPGATGITVPYKRFSLASTTTIFLSTVFVFSSGAVAACGGIYARRVR